MPESVCGCVCVCVCPSVCIREFDGEEACECGRGIWGGGGDDDILSCIKTSFCSVVCVSECM